ncbi:hypothetical protein GCM10027341_42380 [Spirosoma knui]
MNNALFTFAFLGLLTTSTYAQTTYAVQDTTYVRAVENAFTALQKSDCQTCLNQYQKAFKLSQKSALSTLRAAVCAYQCKQEDLAKAYIQRAVDIDYAIAEDTWLDRQAAPELNAVRNTRMNEYVQAIFERRDSLLKLNIPLKRELQTIYQTDQQPRSRIDSVRKVYGHDSPQMRQLGQQIAKTDSINLTKIEQIIRQHGYPGKSLVGSRLGNIAWLVIQHSPLAIQEKYLAMMQKAAEQGEMRKSNLALLTDRIRVYKGQKQLYGTQVTINPTGKNFFDPIEDEANVNKRRAEMGLGPIEEYARQFGFEYQPPMK